MTHLVSVFQEIQESLKSTGENAKLIVLHMLVAIIIIVFSMVYVPHAAGNV